MSIDDIDPPGWPDEASVVIASMAALHVRERLSSSFSSFVSSFEFINPFCSIIASFKICLVIWSIAVYDMLRL
jgi:hypothetical protein